MKSFMANPSNIEHKWYVVDAADKTLGRLAAERRELEGVGCRGCKSPAR